MNLVKWTPINSMFDFHHPISRFFDDFLYPADANAGTVADGGLAPKVDIYDHDDHIVLQAEMPGVDKKDIVVDVKERVLTLKAERSHKAEAKEDTYYRKERSFGRFERSFTLPMDVDAGKIKADYKDGVLKINIPKPEAQKPKQITIH